jgi:DNA polymerase-3 subunit delta'
VALLSGQIARRAVRHAYLFLGPQGVGKRTLALRFMQALNCLQPPEAGHPCLECQACQAIAAATYPDLHILSSQEGKRHLRVDQVRELQRMLALSPYQGNWRVALLLDFHQATAAAANALLKTLEEPAPHVVLLLTALSEDLLLPTIVSRCEILALRALPVSQVEGALVGREVPAEHAALIANLSGGRPGWAIRMAAAEDGLSERREILGLMDTLLRQTRAERFAFVESWERGLRKLGSLDDQRRAATALLEEWLGYWRDILHAALGSGVALRNLDCEGQIRRLATTLSSEQIEEAILALDQALQAIEVNANLRLVMEVVMLRLPMLP